VSRGVSQQTHVSRRLRCLRTLTVRRAAVQHVPDESPRTVTYEKSSGCQSLNTAASTVAIHTSTRMLAVKRGRREPEPAMARFSSPAATPGNQYQITQVYNGVQPSRLSAVPARSLPTTWPVFVFGRSIRACRF